MSLFTYFFAGCTAISFLTGFLLARKLYLSLLKENYEMLSKIRNKNQRLSKMKDKAENEVRTMHSALYFIRFVEHEIPVSKN